MFHENIVNDTTKKLHVLQTLNRLPLKVIKSCFKDLLLLSIFLNLCKEWRHFVTNEKNHSINHSIFQQIPSAIRGKQVYIWCATVWNMWKAKFCFTFECQKFNKPKKSQLSFHLPWIAFILPWLYTKASFLFENL